MPSPTRPHERGPRGRFVALDGVDGCGKSTQAARLCLALRERGRPEPLHVREPGGSALGERVRALLLSREHAISPAVETLLFAAARRAMLDDVVAPALAAGRDVVCERSNASTFAYQACAGDLDEGAVLELLSRWAGQPAPDLTILLDVPPEVAARRRGAPGDRIEDKGLDFQRRVARGFDRWAQLAPRVERIDGEGTEEDVARRIRARVESLAAEVP